MSIYKNHHYINKCKTVSTLRTTGYINGTVDNRERERERERERGMCNKRDRLHERHPSLEYPMHYQYVCSDICEVKSV